MQTLSAHSLTLYSISDIETSGESWLAGQRFYTPVEFVGGLHKQAVNQWTGWMEKKKTPDIMYSFILTHVLHCIGLLFCHCQTPIKHIYY